MLCILSDSSDPFYNLATEEYLLRNYSEDIFLLYVNDPSIIVGKHQNALSEINLDYILDKKIKVARRLSGGGTVYHDRGNLNFCFISTVEGNNKVNFRKYTQPILEALNDIGINASSGGRNDLVAEGFKVSGNAEHVFRNRVLHHGTLLFESDLDVLSEALKVNLSRFSDRSVQSVRSNVINIRELLEMPMSFNDFRDNIFQKLLKNPEAIKFVMPENDVVKIHELSESKFSTWHWNFGYSPNYEYSNSSLLLHKSLTVTLSVEKGRIIKAEILYDNKENISFDKIINNLTGLRHFPDDLFWLNEVQIRLPEGVIEGKEIYSLLFFS